MVAAPDQGAESPVAAPEAPVWKPRHLGPYATVGLLVLASVCTLYFTRDLFLPIVLAVTLKFLLAPAMRLLRRAHIPPAIGAGLLLFVTVGLVVWGLVRLTGPAQELVQKFPDSLEQVQARLRRLLKPVEEVREAAAKVDQMTSQIGESPKVQQVEIRNPSLQDSLYAKTQTLLGTAAVFIPLLYFMLASEDLYLRKLVKVLPRFHDKRKAVEIANQIEREASAYLLGITVVNMGLGAAVGFAMYLLGIPNAALWGLVAALGNYVPYLGAAAGAGSLFVISFLALDDLPRALLATGIFVGLTVIESTFVTPRVVGRRLQLNPVAVFLGLFFWGWIWGIPGVLLAMPLMMMLKILCDHIESLKGVGEFLGS